VLFGVYEPWQASWPITNSRAIHSAATNDANTLTHQDSTIRRLAIATPSTSQSRKNQTIGATRARSPANGCSSLVNLRRTLVEVVSACVVASASGRDGDCMQKTPSLQEPIPI